MISIIIPVYNGEKYLAECLDSVIDQGCEVIVVNDGSTDGTEKIIDQYPVKKINKENGGTASALNCGIKASDGEWIKWVSADDILKKNAVRDMMKLVTDKNRIYYTHYDRFGFKDYTFVEPDYNDNKKAKDILLSRFYGNGSTSLIHKSVFEKCGYFDETVGFQEDYEFWLRCVFLHNIKLHLLDLNTLRYREHSGQLTETKKMHALKKSDEIRKKILKQSPGNYKIKTPFLQKMKSLYITVRFWLASFNIKEYFD